VDSADHIEDFVVSGTNGCLIFGYNCSLVHQDYIGQVWNSISLVILYISWIISLGLNISCSGSVHTAAGS
jgi:hypothetical protein